MKKLFAMLLALCLGVSPCWPTSVTLTGAGKVAAAAGYTGPLDVNGTAFVFWSTRCGSTSYTGNVVDVWDAATGTTTETLITCSSGGVLNISTPSPLATTCASGCVAKTIYDQSGSSKCSGACNLTLGTGSNLPAVDTSFTNGKIGIKFVNTSNNCVMSPALAATQAQPYTISFAGKTTGSAATDNTILENSSNGNNMNVRLDASGGNISLYAGLSATAVASANNLHAIQTLFNTTTSSTYVDGTSTTGLNPFTNGFVAARFNIGASKNGSGTDCNQSFWLGEFLEEGIWAADKTGNNATLNSNQHTYWNF